MSSFSLFKELFCEYPNPNPPMASLKYDETQVLYPGHSWSWYTSFGTQKISPKNRVVLYSKLSLFIKQKKIFLLCKNLPKAEHLRCSPFLDAEEKHRDFMRKHARAS